MTNVKKTKENKKESWEKNKSICWFTKHKDWFILNGAVLAFFLLLLIVNGIKPFGSNSVGRIDWIEQGLPFFSWFWDFLHGEASLTYSPLFGGGANMYGLLISSSAAALFCPIFYLIGLFPRTAIDLGLTVVFAVLLLFIVNIAYFVFRKLFSNVNKWYLIFFAVCWTFSPWIIIHSSAAAWFPVVGVFPLLLLSIKHMNDNGKITLFVALFTYCLILSFYISYMIVVGLVMVGFVYTLMMAREKRKFAASLAFGLVFALLLSFITFYPGITYGLSAYRFGDGVVKEVLYQNFGSKLIPLIWFPLPLILVGAYFIRHFKDDKHTARFFAVTLAILCCGLVIERINAMWHTGSYYSYPHRYSFITFMVLILMSLYYINKFDWRADFKPAADRQIGTVLRSGLCFVAVALLALYAGLGIYYRVVKYEYILHPAMTLGAGDMLVYLLTSCVLILAFIQILKTHREMLRNIFVAGLTLLIMLSFAITNFGLISYSGSSRMDFLQTVDTNDFELPYRIKDKDGLFAENPNYGVILQYPSLSVWMGAHPANPTYAMRYLGFDEQGVWLNDNGGTILSDMLMGNRYIISQSANLNSTVYGSFIKEYEYQGENLYIYEYSFKLPFFHIVDKDIDVKEIIEKSVTEKDNEKYDAQYLIAAQNALWQKLFTRSDTIIEKTDTANVTIENVYDKVRKVTVTANSGGKLENLYMHLDMERLDNVYYVPAADFDAAEYEKVGNYDYTKSLSTAVSHGFFDLGVLDTQTTLEFYIVADDFTELGDLYFAEFDISKLYSISTAANNYTNFEYTDTGMKFTVTGTSGQKVIIPATNLTGVTAKINGQTVAVDGSLTAYMSVDLVDGENNIEIIYTPMNFKMGLIVTVATLILLLILFILNRFFNLTDKVWVQWVGVCIGGGIFLAVAYLVFLKPFAITIITDIFRIGA
jgi:uncharacterized membrane protein YfhO